MEKHELVDKNGNKTGKILTHIEARNPNNVPNGYYISVVGVVVINENNVKGMRTILQVFKDNPARRLYERLGFKIYNETETHYQVEKL